jgi:hypothetical protein
MIACKKVFHPMIIASIAWFNEQRNHKNNTGNHEQNTAPKVMPIARSNAGDDV